MKRYMMLALFSFGLVSCPRAVDSEERHYPEERHSEISYCSGGQTWLPGHAAPRGNCEEPRRSYPPEGDMA